MKINYKERFKITASLWACVLFYGIVIAAHTFHWIPVHIFGDFAKDMPSSVVLLIIMIFCLLRLMFVSNEKLRDSFLVMWGVLQGAGCFAALTTYVAIGASVILFTNMMIVSNKDKLIQKSQ
jgi:uncharacterized membrane protein